MKCPTCASGNVKKSSALYEQQSTRYDGSSQGWWITSKGTIGVGQSRSQGRRTSVAIERNAPPLGVGQLVGCAVIGPMVVIPILVLIGLPLWLSILLPPTVAVGLAIWVHRLKKDEWSQQDQAYSRQWYCSKCGSLFIDDKAALLGTGEGRRTPVDSEIATLRIGPDRQAYVDRVLSPIQRAKTPTDRDLLGLSEILKRSGEDHSFEPAAMDKGLISRLASLGFITYDPVRNQFLLTAAGLACTPRSK